MSAGNKPPGFIRRIPAEIHTGLQAARKAGLRPTPPHQLFRIGHGAGFGGYTGGGTKEIIRGMMSTGDVGHFDTEGRLFIDGRDDEMIVSGGENVFPREVEELLAGHPGIVEAAAVGVEDEQFGHRLRAFVVARPEASVTADDVRAYVREHLARFKIPRDVVFVDALPRNPAGKVLKRVLVEQEA